jgi:hypothetical protein
LAELDYSVTITMAPTMRCPLGIARLFGNQRNGS